MISFFVFLLIIALLSLVWASFSVAPIALIIMVAVFISMYFVNRGIKFGVNFTTYNLSSFNIFSIIFLLASLLLLSERALYDIARIFVGPNYDYLNSLNTILAHAMFIIPVFVFSIILNMLIGEKLKKYAVVVIPYLITSIILIAQLSIQVITYFYDHHTNWQLYVVMTVLALISSVSIYVIQNRMPMILSENVS